VSLTDDEIFDCVDEAGCAYCVRDGDKQVFIARAIEAKLKEKNA
jgi:hypothetical protein